jgi:hypothetical protein
MNATVTRQLTVVAPHMTDYHHVAIIVNILIAVLIPLAIIVSVNTLLVVSLRRQQDHVCRLANGDSRHKQQMRSSQRKVTAMVIVIVSAFTITQLPSAVIYLWELVVMMIPYNTQSPYFNMFAVIANSCVITGKTCM